MTSASEWRRRVVPVVLLAAVGAVVVATRSILPLVALGAAVAVASSSARRRRDRVVEERRRQLPAALDQVAICMAAGLTPSTAFDRVARSGATPVGWWSALADLLADGVALADAIDRAGDRGDVWITRELGSVAAAARAGGSVPAAVDRAVADLRARNRREREERARRLPVLLLAPLTLCVLPAVVLVVVVPMVGHSLIGGP